MFAITPNGIGKKVGARRIKPNWDLAEGETFTVEDFNEDLVLAEDGVSLRQGTYEELNPIPTDEERIDSAFPQSDTGQLLIKLLFNIENRTRALEGKNPITMSQYKSALKDLL